MSSFCNVGDHMLHRLSSIHNCPWTCDTTQIPCTGTSLVHHTYTIQNTVSISTSNFCKIWHQPIIFRSLCTGKSILLNINKQSTKPIFIHGSKCQISAKCLFFFFRTEWLHADRHRKQALTCSFKWLTSTGCVLHLCNRAWISHLHNYPHPPFFLYGGGENPQTLQC